MDSYPSALRGPGPLPNKAEAAPGRPLIRVPLHKYVHTGSRLPPHTMAAIESQIIDVDEVRHPDNPCDLPLRLPLTPKIVLQAEQAKAAISDFAACKLGLDISRNVPGSRHVNIFRQADFDAWLDRYASIPVDSEAGRVKGLVYGRHVLTSDSYTGSELAHILLHEGLHAASAKLWRLYVPSHPGWSPSDVRAVLISNGFVGLEALGRHYLQGMREYVTETTTLEVAKDYAPRIGLQADTHPHYQKLMRLGDYVISHASSAPELRRETTPEELIAGLQRDILTAGSATLISIARTVPLSLRRQLAATVADNHEQITRAHDSLRLHRLALWDDYY